MDSECMMKVLEVVRADTNPALGCTEPVAVAYAAAVAKDYLVGDIDSLDVIVSKSIYKNGKSVMIPHTGDKGLELAAAVGLIGGNSEYGFMVLKDLDENQLEAAKRLIYSGKVRLSYDESAPAIYVNIIVKSGADEISVILKDAHTHIDSVSVNGELFYEDHVSAQSGISADFLKDMTVVELREISEEIPSEFIEFIGEGVAMNMEAAESGMRESIGLSVGKNLNLLQQKGLISIDASTKARILTAAAADMRMGGGDCPIMTSGGSGNQGLGVILPIAVVAEEKNIDDEKRNRAIFFAHAVNKFVKVYSGKLSGMCGCAIGAGIGAAAGITWMLGGSDEQIEGACNNLFANLTGIICDGAKDTCSLKLSSCAGESVLAAYLSLNDVRVNPSIGIVGGTIEQTIANIGKLSHDGFEQVDRVMLDIIDN